MKNLIFQQCRKNNSSQNCRTGNIPVCIIMPAIFITLTLLAIAPVDAAWAKDTLALEILHTRDLKGNILPRRG